MASTRSRTWQWLAIIVAFLVLGGGYWYWRASAGSTITDRPITYATLTSGSATTTDPATTASISPGANRLILAAVSSNSLQTPTLTGNGLTWVEIGASQDAARRTVLFRAMSAAPTTGAVTIDWASAPGEQRWVISEFDNVDTSGTNGSGAIVQSVMHYNDATTNFTLTMAEFAASGNATYGVTQSYTVDSNSVSTGSGFTSIVNHGTAFKQVAEYKLASDTTVDWTSINNNIWRAIAVEIKKKGSTKLNTSIRDSLYEGLVGYWKLDDGSGTTATDSSVNGNNGTLTNGPTWGTGQIGGDVDIDGTDDYINIGDVLDVSDGQDFSVSGWFYRDTDTSNDIIFYKGTVTGLGYYVNLTSNIDSDVKKLKLRVSDGTDTYTVVSSQTIVTGVWTHFMAVFDDDSAGGTNLYINGVLDASTKTGTLSNVNDLSSTASLRIGATSYDGSGVFDGKLDEIRMYNRVLSTEEVTRLYKTTTSGNPDTRLKGYWSFDGDSISGTTALDLSGSGNNGTLTNGPTKTIGIRGQAMSFDGTDDRVSVSSAASISLSNYTYTFWVRGDGAPSVTGTPTQVLNKSAGHAGSDIKNNYVFTWNHGSSAYVQSCSHSTGGSWVGAAKLTSTLLANTWYFITCSYDGTSIRAYLNGVLEATFAVGSPDQASMPLCVGCGWNVSDAPQSFFSGKIDEIRIYNAALSASEIWNLYQEGGVKVNKSQSNNSDSLNDGLAGYWKLDDASGTTATDSSTNGYTGTLTNGPTWTTGQMGGAVTFDGTDDVITAGNNLDIGTGDVTMSAWINAANANQCSTIMGKRVDSGGYAQYTFWAGHLDSSGVCVSSKKIACFFYDGSFVDNIHSQNYRTTDDILDGSWHHVVCRRKSGQSLAIFVDGVSRALTAANPNTTSVNTSNAGPFVIGARNITGGSSFTGTIDEARLYNRALSDEEIARLYKTTSPGNPETGLVGYWSFNGSDMSSTTAYDRSGKGSSGTLNGGPVLTIGKIGQALSFDNNNDWVAAQNSSAYRFPNTTFSVAAWFRRTSVTGGGTMVANGACSGGWRFYSASEVGFTLYQAGACGPYAAYRLSSTSGLSDGQWHFAVAVVTTDTSVSGNNTVSLYIDGALNQGALNQNGAYASPANTYLEIGSYDNGFGSFNGAIDEVRVYNRALSSTEIQSLYNFGR